MSREDEYTPIRLWLRQDQLDKINKDTEKYDTTIYTFIRNIIDYYYENKQENLNEKTNSFN